MPYDTMLRALVSKGYFPNELPPAFTTANFGSHVVEVLDDWRKKDVYRIVSGGKVPRSRNAKSGSYTYKFPAADPEFISKPKKGFERRNLSIVHLVPHALLCLELTSNWKAVQKWLSRQLYSLDRIQIGVGFTRSIRGVNFELHRAKKDYIEAISDWLVMTDISRFYPTIYTHSIPWAAYGKDKVKANIQLYQGSLADRIDALVRSGNRNQTVGIPIGPETSRIIAEIISSRIDNDFSVKENVIRQKLTSNHVDRLQDDWYVGVDSLENAERILASITEVYRDYGLEINGSKTAVDRVIAISPDQWVSEIGSFLSHRSGPIRGARLRELLSLCLRLQKEFMREPIVNYTLSILEAQRPATVDVESLESFLLKASVISPVSMDRICRMILNLQFNTKELSKRRICFRFTQLAERHILNGNLYEAIWLIYTLRGLRTAFRSKVISGKIESLNSSVLALVLLDMQNKGLFLSPLPKSNWEGRLTQDSIMTEWTWLLAYEGIRHGWLRDGRALMTKPFFSAMASRGVVFYDERRNVPKLSSIVRIRNISRKSHMKAVSRLKQTIRGLEPY